jgi:LPS-assembly protein
MPEPILARLFAALPLVLLCGGALAAGDDLGKSISKDKPVMLTADKVTYDEPRAIATASGKVEVVQGDTILLADEVTYNQNTNMVHAHGHVSVLEPTGDVFFSDDADLRNDMQKGVVNQFRARLKDNSLFAAREAVRVNKNVTKMKDVVYSPCKVCQPQPGEGASAPLWQITADKATIDEDEKRVRYQNAIMDMYGLPVLYTPYFSHPTPDAPNESGLLQPQYFHDSLLGSVIKEPVYYTFAPNLDMTLTPWYMTNEHPLLEGEFRGLSQNGSFEMRGAITDAYNRDDSGDVIPGSWTRGFIEAHGKYQLNPDWDVGLDAEHASDETFLQFYHFGYADMLTSRLYAERVAGRDYFSVESLAFQGLQPEDQASVSPYILPQVNYHYESDPLALHSRIQLDTNALVLEREQGDDDQRFSTTAAWKLPYITHGGQVFEFTASLRGDAYHVSNQVTDATTDATFNGDTGRFIPQVNLDWRYPFINRFGEGRSLMIAPVAELTASPSLHATSNIPNEDSQVAELSDVNLFSPDRFAGLDQVESGPRAVYGTRGQLQFADQEYLEWMLGQAYQENEDSPFPLTSSTVAHYSDYIGRLAFKYHALDVSYDFRIDRQTFAPTSNEINAIYSLKPLNFNITYLSLQNEPLFGDRKEIYGNTSFDLSQHWMLTLGGRRDLGSSEEEAVNTSLPVSALNPLEPTAGTVGINSGIVFHNECVTITTMLNRSYISQQDVKPSTTFGVTLILKNFGATDPQASTNSMAGPGNITTLDTTASINSNQDTVNPSGSVNNAGAVAVAATSNVNASGSGH